MSAHSGKLEGQNIMHWMHTWQQCSVIISEDILKTKYYFDLRYIAPQCWLTGIDSDTNPATFWSPKKEVPLFTDLRFPGHILAQASYASLRTMQSSTKSCIGHRYVYVYEVGYRIVALKGWYQQFLPNTPETMFGDETLQNLLDAFPVPSPLHGLVSIHPIRRLIVRSREVFQPQDLCLKLSYCCEIWQALWQHYCRDVCQIFQNDAIT